MQGTDGARKSNSQSLQGSGAKYKTSSTPTSTPTSATMITSAATPSATASTSTGTGFAAASGTLFPTFTSETDVLFDVSTARTITTTIVGYKLCEPFKQLQIQAAATINDPEESLPAANYIWMSSTRLPGLTREAHSEIIHSVHRNEHPLPESLLTLWNKFSSELAETGRVRARLLDTKEEKDLTLLYQNMSKKMPKEYFAWVQKNEVTFAHGTVDIILKHFFPENTSSHELDWGNHSASGSKARRGDPLKPDATVLKSGMEVGYVEIKAPKDSHSQSKFVEDLWSVASEARDQIDLHLRNQRLITVVPCIQIFGKVCILELLGKCKKKPTRGTKDRY
ncbi:hypothetical protein BGX30_006717 [Mortierella sp. GBA39]|nr:hypothetical protein BGX30_006717 [Mortierella sp. GBA39]